MSNTWDMQERSGWGDSIRWLSWEDRRVVGHTTPAPKAGDVLLAAMQSGKKARFLFAGVERCGDPEDMWFATVQDIGYEEGGIEYERQTRQATQATGP